VSRTFRKAIAPKAKKSWLSGPFAFSEKAKGSDIPYGKRTSRLLSFLCGQGHPVTFMFGSFTDSAANAPSERGGDIDYCLQKYDTEVRLRVGIRPAEPYDLLLHNNS
jgi:hypothetical protein